MNTEQLKRSEEKERRRLEALWWASALIWAGLVFAADALGFLPQIGQADAWSWVFLGAGLLSILGNLFRMSTPDYPNPAAWDWVWGGVFLILGLGGFIALEIFWPLILVLVGFTILVSALRQR